MSRPTESVRRIKLLAPTFARRWLAELLSVVYTDRDDVILRQTADRIRHADNRTYVDLLLGELGPRVKTPITVTSRAGSLANMLAATNDDDLARLIVGFVWPSMTEAEIVSTAEQFVGLGWAGQRRFVATMDSLVRLPVTEVAR